MPDRAVKRVAVVIPNFNGEPHLMECLEALRNQSFQMFECIVVDNGSSDRSIAVVNRLFPGSRVIELGHNWGFAAAANAGIAEADAELIALLNADTVVSRDWLERLVTAMDEHPRASLAASMLVCYEDPTVIDAAGDGFSLTRGAGIRLDAGRPAQIMAHPKWVIGACGAAAMYRRTLLDDIGGFDEDFFLTHEDVDLSMRALVAGHSCLLVPRAVVRHKRNSSYDAEAPWLRAIAARNRMWVLAKNLPGPVLLVCLIASLPRSLIVLGKGFAGHRRSGDTSGSPFGSTLIRELRRGLSLARRKRREMSPLRRLNSRALLRRLVRPGPGIGYDT